MEAGQRQAKPRAQLLLLLLLLLLPGLSEPENTHGIVEEAGRETQASEDRPSLLCPFSKGRKGKGWVEEKITSGVITCKACAIVEKAPWKKVTFMSKEELHIHFQLKTRGCFSVLQMAQNWVE